MGQDGTNLFFPDPFHRKTTIPTSIGNNGRLDAIVISCGKLTQCRLEANIPYRSKCTFITNRVTNYFLFREFISIKHSYACPIQINIYPHGILKTNSLTTITIV